MLDERDNEETNRTILYYPTITLPEGQWLRQALLYWDQISSIVPLRYDIDSKRYVPVIPYTPDVEYLADEQVFRPIIPDNFFELEDCWTKRDEFFEELKRIVKSKEFQKSVPPWRKRAFTSKIHRDKVSERVCNWLRKNGLAKRLEDGLDWFLFETFTGLLYMALLAKYLADIDARHTMPGTNMKNYQSFVFDSPDLKQGFACLDVRYRNALPIPREDVSLSDILDFKRKGKHRDALLRFRTELDKLHSVLSSAEAKGDVSQILAGFKERVELGLSEITEVLHESGIETITGCLKTLVNLKSPTLWGAAGVIAGKATKLADVPLEWSLPGIGLLGAVEVGHLLVHRSNEKRAKLRGSNFAYLYHAQEWGII